MKTMKRSKAVKIICFILTSLFLFLTCCGAMLSAVLASDRAPEQMTKETASDFIFDDVYNALSARQAHRLYRNGIFSYAINGEGDAYFAERPALRQGNTNYTIKVVDPNGKVLLQNFEPKDTYTAYTFFYDYPVEAENNEETHSTEWTLETAAPEETVTEETDTTTLPQSEQATEPTAAQPTDASEIADTTAAPAEEPLTPEPSRSVDTQEAPTAGNPVKSDDEDIYIEDLREEYGLSSIFMYIYPAEDGMNDAIREYCLTIYTSDFEPGEAEYYLHGQYEIYRQTDFAVSTNGSVYFIGTLRGDEPIESTTDPNYRYESLTLTVAVDKALTADDTLAGIAKLKTATNFCLTHLGGICLALLALTLIFGILSLICAGWVKNGDRPVARGVHRIPLELVIAPFIAAFATGAVCGVGWVRTAVFLESDMDGFVLTMPVWAVLCWWCIYTFAVRVKAKALGSTFWLGRFCKWLFALLANGVRALRFEWKLAIGMLAIYIGGGIAGLICILSSDYREVMIIPWILWKIAELVGMVLLAVNLNTLHEGAKALSEGKDTTVENRFLFGEFRKHAGYLNSVGDGINAAVEERVKSESTKTELITNISHDLKTPLTSIVNYIDLLKKEPAGSEKAKEYIAAIDRASQRLKKLTGDIVDASKAAAGSIQMTPEDMDLKVLLGQMKGEYEERLAAKRLTLVESLPETPLTVWADGRLLWRVLDNLMSNVAKYSMPGTRVYLTVTGDDGKAKIEFKNISETPLNVDPATLTDRFVRGDASRNSEGSGLGLNIAQSLTRNMGGSLTVGIDGDLFKATLLFPLKKV